MTPIRVLLADDHALLRAGIGALLRTLEGVEVVGEAVNGLEALEMALALKPDVLLTDLSTGRKPRCAAGSRAAVSAPS